MHCVITVKGNGVGRYGHPKTDRTGPVSEFLVDNGVFYTAVYKHVKDCPTCDPVQVLKVYLDRRTNGAKFNGVTSDGQVKLALKYERLFKKNKVQYDTELINEFLWRSTAFEEYEARIGVRGMARALVNLFTREPHSFQPYLNHSKTVIKTLANLVQNAGPGILSATDDDFNQLLQVAEVQLC